MAQVVCTPRPNTFPAPSYAGTGLPGPNETDLIVTSENTPSGDILDISFTNVRTPPDGFVLTHFEVWNGQAGQTPAVGRLYNGPFIDANAVRKVKVSTPLTETRIQVREVYQQRNEFAWVRPTDTYNILVGDSIEQSATAMTAVVTTRTNTTGATWDIGLGSIDGNNAFAPGQPIIIDGNKTASVDAISGNVLTVTLYPEYAPLVGDIITQHTGASATVADVTVSSGDTYRITTTGQMGAFADESITIINGTPGKQLSLSYHTVKEEYRVKRKSEWSRPIQITPATGTPTVTITANKTTCMKGEAVLLRASPKGFQSLRPFHDLRYKFSTSKAGEQGDFASLPAWWESRMGVGSKSRADGFSPLWTFCPRTSGTVDIDIEVRDFDGNVATDTLTITVTEPTAEFTDTQVYAVSSTARAVPGFPGATIYTDVSSMITAINGLNGFNLPKGMILLDTNDADHQVGDGSLWNLQDYFVEKFAFMPYSDSGIGPDAGARANFGRALKSRSDNWIFYGINATGNFDPTDPFSATFAPEKALDLAECAFASVAECDFRGWGITLALPEVIKEDGVVTADRQAAYYDLLITDFHNFGLQAGDCGAHSMAGVFAYTNPQSWRKGGKGDTAADGFFVDHGPYRCSRPNGERGFSKCYFFSCCSWGGTGEPQSPLRLFGSGNTSRPELIYGSQVLTEGGAFAIDASTRGGGDTTVHPQNIVWEKFLHITSMQPRQAFGCGVGGVTVRNGYFVTSSNAAELNTNGVTQHMKFENTSSVPGQLDNENQPININFVTVIDLRYDAGQETQSLNLFSNDASAIQRNLSLETDISSILTYAPNFTASDTAFAPLDTTTLFTPLYAGQYFWNDTITGTNAEKVAGQSPDTSWATPTEVSATFAPQAGSAAIASVTDVKAVDDFFGSLRTPGAQTKGAIEVNTV